MDDVESLVIKINNGQKLSFSESENLKIAEKIFQYLEDNPGKATHQIHHTKRKHLNSSIKRLLKGRPLLQEWLSPDLKAAREAFEKENHVENKRKLRFEYTKEKAKLGARFSYGFFNTGEGANGAKYIADFEDTLIAVYKPVNPERTQVNTIVQPLKNLAGQARLLNSSLLKAPQYAEEVSYKLDRAYEFNVAPIAEMMTLPNGERVGARDGGVIIEYLEGYKTLSSVKQQLEKRESFTKEENILFQKLTIYDFFRGNLDGHSDNILVKLDKEGKIQDIKIIDGGNSFRLGDPSKGALGNMYEWRNIKNLAEQKFEPEIIQFTNEMTTSPLNQLIEKTEEEFWDCKNWKKSHKENAVDRINDRFNIIKESVGKILLTSKDLGNICTKKDHKQMRFQNEKR